jgi:putative hemolysin
MILDFFYTEFHSILILIVCLFLSAFFSSAETAITSLGTLKVKHLINSMPKISYMNLWLKHPRRVLTTILIYNNVVNILASAVITQLANQYFKSGVIGIATGITTFLVLVFGEIIPKSFARTHSQKVALFSMKILILVYYCTYPIIRVLSGFADYVIKFFSDGENKPPLITEEELEFLMIEGKKAGVLEDIKKDIIEGAFDFDDTKVREILTPRTNMTALTKNVSLAEAIKVTIDTGHSRIPVYDESIDKVVGILFAKDLLHHSQNVNNKPLKTKDVMRQAFFVPESKSIMEAFKDLKRSRNHMAIVIDEYGGTAGLVTMEDILEEIVGEIQDEFDVEQTKILKTSANTYEVSGAINIDEFFEYFELNTKILDELKKEQDADTLAGWITQLVGQMPKVGQKVSAGPFSFEVLEVSNKRINLIKVKTISNNKIN